MLHFNLLEQLHLQTAKSSGSLTEAYANPDSPSPLAGACQSQFQASDKGAQAWIQTCSVNLSMPVLFPTNQIPQPDANQISSLYSTNCLTPLCFKKDMGLCSWNLACSQQMPNLVLLGPLRSSTTTLVVIFFREKKDDTFKNVSTYWQRRQHSLISRRVSVSGWIPTMRCIQLCRLIKKIQSQMFNSIDVDGFFQCAHELVSDVF